jgi:predicted nucleic acid-binding protein
MIGWLLDTHIVGALASPTGAPSVRDWAAAQEEQRMFLSVLILAEIEQGIERLPPGDPDRSRHSGTLHAIEARFAGRILPLGDAVVRRWGRIAGRVKRETGRPPPVIDTLLAATAIEHDLYLATRNTKDVSHSGAALFNPWLDDPARFPLS